MNGTADHYEGRQDLGDGDGSLVEHIEQYHTYYLNDKEWENYLLRNEGREALEADKEHQLGDGRQVIFALIDKPPALGNIGLYGGMVGCFRRGKITRGGRI